MTSTGFLYSNGMIFYPPDTPAISTFLESNPGAYTTTRTHNNTASLLFWDRHLQRLSNSVKILLNSNPQFLFKSLNSTINPLLNPPPPPNPMWESTIKSLVNETVNKVLPVALRETRNEGEELAVTALVTGNTENLSEVKGNLYEALDVHVHVGSHVPHVFGVKGNGARVAVVGPGRDIAEAKYSDWVRLRKSLEKLRPPSVTELLLSKDGDRILEGCVTNFFAVCRKDYRNEKYLGGNENTFPYEVQTAPIGDGVLPGVIRQLVIEVCLSKGIPFREVAPSWSEHEFWQEAFITSSLRIVQRVEKIQVPSSWQSLELKALKEISWEEKQFEEDPGMITALIQKEIMEKAGL
ncbi:hypothetical protein POTOM_038797 [Populus tomentosa]|uniref:D-aminoacid aminotransferase-like PLP-dependent enzymes superfamily protein n=1 Tax=Populus tomentosa TaxID=118781 RepID=A0A8X8CLH5_POPTO|nr:hypothetical protein POTOM_038797 [Populus tomentosa]